MLAEMGFRGLLGGVWKGRLGSCAALTSDSLITHVQEVFREQIDARVMKSDEIQQIAALTYRHMNHDGADGISCNDYVQSVMHDETFDPSLLCKVLQDRDEMSMVQKFFSGNTHKLRVSMRMSKNSSGSDTAEAYIARGFSSYADR